MVFANYSQGYRPATQNRNAGQIAGNQTGVYQNYAVPAAAKTDELTSYEVGLKSYLADRSVRLNATLYHAQIEELQVSRFDPSNVAFLFFIENVGDAESTGLDVDFQWAAGDAWTISGAFSLIDTELTRLNDQLQGIAVPVGSELPFASPLAGYFRARYEFPVMGGLGYITASVNHRGENVTGIVGSAEFMEDTLRLASGNGSGFSFQEEGGTFGTVEIPDGAGGSRLPVNSRYVNPSATTANLGFGLEEGRLGGGNLHRQRQQRGGARRPGGRLLHAAGSGAAAPHRRLARALRFRMSRRQAGTGELGFAAA